MPSWIWQPRPGVAATVVPGPVQLNLPFEEPLHASPDDQASLQAASWRRLQAKGASGVDPGPAAPPLDPKQAGVVVAGPWRGLAPALPAYQQALRQWLSRSGWPLLADPLAAIPADCPGQVDGWELQLDRLALPARQPRAAVGALARQSATALQAWLQQQAGRNCSSVKGIREVWTPSAWQINGVAGWRPGGQHRIRTPLGCRRWIDRR